MVGDDAKNGSSDLKSMCGLALGNPSWMNGIGINGSDDKDKFPFILIAQNMPKHALRNASAVEQVILNYPTGNLTIPKEHIRPIIKYQKLTLFMSYYVKRPCTMKDKELIGGGGGSRPGGINPRGNPDTIGQSTHSHTVGKQHGDDSLSFGEPSSLIDGTGLHPLDG